MKKPQETKELLNQAIGLNTHDRTLLLEQIDDSKLRSQVETLLADDVQLQVFLTQESKAEATQHSQTEAIGPGSLINRIRIIKLLGQGGMGSVYLGFDEKLERQVAVKSIRSEHLKNQSTQQRFVREAQILSKINHPSICQLYDYLETPHGDFLVLEYIKGKPLYQSPLTYEQKLNAMADLAAALSVAHAHGIVHRDLKPDNIMITDEGQLKVLDFGIAQSLTKAKVLTDNSAPEVNIDLTQQGSLVGTIRYMSPEQAQGKNIHTASDMYALGIIAQEVFSHQAAYQVMETEQLLTDVQQGNRVAVTDLPESLEKLIDQLTQLTPEDRPTADATAQQIKAILNAPKLRRKKQISIAIVVAALVLVSVLLWQWQQFGQQQARTKQINQYEIQINDLVKQGEQIYVLPIHPVNEEISLLMKQGEVLYWVIQNDELLTEIDKKRLQGIIVLKGELYEDSIPLLVAGQAESYLLAYAWSNQFIEKASLHTEQQGFQQTLKDQVFRKKYLTPALKYIEQAHAEAGQVIPLFRAFELSQAESLEAGLQAVNQLLAEEHWNKEAVNLKALILSASMSKAREKGDWEQAKMYALMTAEAYQLSTQMARSYPPSYSNLCLTNLRLMADGIQRSGEQVDAFTEQSIAACENALKLQPEYKYPKQLLARIYIMKAQWEISFGLNADDSLRLAKHWNQQAMRLDDLYVHSWIEALILATESKQLMLNGKPAQPVIDQSLVLFDQILTVDSAYRPYVVSDLLFVLAQQSHELIRQNQDAKPVFQRALNLFDESMLVPDLVANEQWELVKSMAQVYSVELQDQFEQEQNILPLGQKLIEFLSPAENRLKNHLHQLTQLANTHLVMAEYLRRQQQPLNKHLDTAADAIHQALSINPNNAGTLISLATLMTLQEYISDQNYTQANQVFKQATTINSNNPYLQNAWARSLLVQAQKSQTTALQKTAIQLAHEKVKQALAVDKLNQTFLTTQTELLEIATSNGVTLNPK